MGDRCIHEQLEAKYYRHLAELWLWHLKILDVHNSVNDIPHLQEEGLGIIGRGVKLMPEVYNRPNGHGVIEMITRTLPALVYVRLVASGDFERHHQITKKSNPSRHFVENAMKTFNVLDTLRLLLHGGRWGPKREFILGVGLRCLKNPKNPKIPHPLITNVTSVIRQEVPTSPNFNLYHYNDEWDTYGYEYMQTSHHIRKNPPDECVAASILLTATDLGEEIDSGSCSWAYPTRLRKWYNDGVHRIIHVGQTVLCQWDTGPAFAKIHKFIELRYRPPVRTGRKRKCSVLFPKTLEQQKEQQENEWRIVFVQAQWYSDIGRNEKRHKHRKTRFMKLDESLDTKLFTCGHIVRQVLAVHCCQFPFSIQIPFTPFSKCCTVRENEHYCNMVARCHHHADTNCTEHKTRTNGYELSSTARFIIITKLLMRIKVCTSIRQSNCNMWTLIDITLCTECNYLIKADNLKCYCNMMARYVIISQMLLQYDG